MSGSYNIDISGDICIRKFYGEIHLNTIQHSWLEMLAVNNLGKYKGF
jgi:hypothetical protein